MKIKTTIVRPGTILCWKEYNIFTKLWNKLKKRDLPYNKFEIIPTSIELLTIDRYNFVAYTPIRKYNNTFDNSSTKKKCKKNKKKDLNEVSSEYIY